jgi:hypothetical protein
MERNRRCCYAHHEQQNSQEGAAADDAHAKIPDSKIRKMTLKISHSTQ